MDFDLACREPFEDDAEPETDEEFIQAWRRSLASKELESVVAVEIESFYEALNRLEARIKGKT